MKVKTFILTFLMMMSSPFLFGQHWTDPGNLGYQNSMTVYAQVKLDNVVQTNDYQVAAFHGDQLLAVSEIIPFQGTTSNYHVHLQIYGDNSMGNIYFKFFNGTKEYVSETEFPFEVNVNIGDHPNYSTINFYSVAQIGDVVYPSLQKAIDAAANDDVVTLLKDNAENVTVVQAPDVAFTIDGAEKTMSGTITVNGKSSAYATAGLTIKNVNFDATNISKDASINLGGDNNTRYTNGVTVENCDFEGDWFTTGEEKGAIKNYTGGCKNLKINNCTASSLHSLAQLKGVGGLTVSRVTVSYCKNGVSVGTSTNVAISNSNITATGYGVRADGDGAYKMTLTNNTISAELPVVVRKAAEVAYDLKIDGDNNNFTAEQQGNNPEGYQVVFTTGDDGTYLAPTTGQFLLSVPENFNVYPVYVAQVGNLKYTSVVTAINEAADGATVQLLPGTIEEYVAPWITDTQHTSEKSITIVGSKDDEGKLATTLTVGMYLGYEDGQCREHTIFVKDVKFEGKGLKVACQQNVTIEGNKFNNITEGRAIAVVGKNINSVVKNNVIDGVTTSNPGIELRNTLTATVEGNIISNTGHNALQITSQVDATASEINVTNNTMSNWGTAQNAQGELEGRAMRINNIVTANINGNVMSHTSAPEEFVKVTGATTLDASANYWNGESPLTDGMFTGVEGDLVPVLVSYYTNVEKTNLVTLAPSVAKIGDVYYQSLQAAINDATEGQTVIVLENVELENTVTVAAGKVVTLDLNGKTVSGISNVASTTAVILNKGNLTVQSSIVGGKITTQALQPDTNWGGEGEPPYPTYANNTIRNEGTFTLVSGRIENMSPAGGATYAIDNYNGSTTNIDGGEVYCKNNLAIRLFCGDNISLNIDGGKIQGTRALWIQLANSNSSVAPNVKVNISDGEIIATGENNGYIQALYSYSYGNDMKNVKINISGGTFYGDINLTGGSNKTNIETLNISGGTFNGNEYDINSYGADEKAVGAISITGGTFSKNYAEKYALDNGYVFVPNQDGKYVLDEFEGFEIPNLDRLIAFRNAVNAGNTFANKTVTVTADINMESVENWTPIGTLENPFLGTFDGGNKTISNLKVNGGAYVGLFGYANNATIKNVKINNANVKGTNCVGVIAGDVYSTSLIDNCHVSGSIKVEGQTNVGGIVGKYYTKVTNSSVIGDGVATSYVKGVHYAADYEGDNIGGIMGHGGENNTFTNNTVKNITISGTRKVGGIVGVTDQNTDVTNCLVENVNIETTATAEYASANAAKAGHASIVGSYTKLGTNNNGTVTNCVVKYVTFVNNDNVTMSAGPITGGAREGMIDPTGVTASGNLVYMSTITGNTTNMYLMKAVAKIDETNYYTLDEAIAAANNQTVTVLENVELRNTLTIEAGKTVTLDLNGKTINAGWEDQSAGKHIYAFTNNGTLTIKGEGTINARGNFNYGTLTLEKGTINAIDHNGGYGVRNYEGSKFTMNGGLIATTNENGDIPGDGYDATTVRVDSGAEFIMNGGKINNISNYTFAIDNYGTTTIKENAGEVKSVHTTLANYGTMTISAGTFICNGLEGVTAHALWADAGTTIINGGTFDGKDNYNGFNVCASAGAVVEINGGKFESVHSGSLYGDGTITVKGGTFFDVVQEIRLAPGYVCKQNADGTYGVFLGVAKIEGGAIYGTLQAAVNAADATNNTITLINNVQLNAYVTINKSVTLDLGEYNITRENGTALYVNGENIEVTIDGEGTVSGTQAVYVDNGIVAINGGNYVGNFEAVYVKGTGHVVINDGTFSGENENKNFILNEYDATRATTDITVKGGTFVGFNPQNNAAEGANTDFCDANYAATQTETGVWAVLPAVAKIGESRFATLQDAVNAADATNNTITLIDNVQLDAFVTIDRSVTLNLGEYNITREDGTALYFNGEGIEVTIDGEGTVSGTQAVYVDNGIVAINGGNYVGNFEAVYVKGTGHVVINDGTFSGENENKNFILNEYDATRATTDITVKGGTFVGFNPQNNAAEGANTNFCAEGYAATETETGVWAVLPVVAKIGEATYATVQDAINVATATDVIDVVGTTTEENITIADNADITLTFAENVTLNGYFAPFNGNLTINDGTINNTNSGASAIEINAGELNLNNVNIASARHAVRIDGAVTATINGGEYTLTATSGTRHAVNVSGGAEVTIKAGTFVGPKGTTMDSGSAVCVQASSNVTIEGGNYSGGKNNTLASAGTLVVTGGTFDQDPSAYVTTPYVVIKKSDNEYNVIKGVAKIGETYYATLQEAIGNVKNGETINLLVACAENVSIDQTEGVSFTIDGQIAENTKVQYTGTISIDGKEGYNSAETLTIKNINFYNNVSDYGITFIDAKTKTQSHNVTIESCVFDGNGNTLAKGIQVSEGNNWTVKGCTVNNNYNIFIDYAGAYNKMMNNNLLVDGCTINAKQGVLLGRFSNNCTIQNTSFDCATLGINVASRVGTTEGEVLSHTLNNVNFTGKAINCSYTPTAPAHTHIFNIVGEVTSASELSFPDLTNAGGRLNFVLTTTDATLQAKGQDYLTVNVSEELAAQHYEVVYDVDTYKAVKEKNVKNITKAGEPTYPTLAEAITAASAGDKLVLLNNIIEDVTISKNLTIDGAQNNYTGTMTGNSGLKVTVQNLNFVNAGFVKSTKSTTGTYTFNNCTFDGKGTYAYPLCFKGANKLTVENCSVQNYLYSFLYISSGTNTVNVKNVTVENCPNYGVYFASGVNSANIENLTVKNSNNGFVINNTADRTFNLKGCKFENVATAINHSNGTNTVTCNLYGEDNDFGTSALSDYATIVLAEADATLTAPEGYNNVTTSVEGSLVKYGGGKYVVKGAIAQIGDEIYASLQEAIDAAVNDDEIVVLQDINIANVELQKLEDSYDTYFLVEGKKVTINLNGKTISGEYTGSMLVGVFSTDKNGELTLTGNGTVDVTTNTKVYTLITAFNDGSKITIENGTYKLNKASDDLIFYGGHTDKEVIVKGGTFTLGNVGEGENGKPWIFNVLGAGDHHVYVKGGTFNADINRQHWSNEAVVAETHYTVYNGDGTYTVKDGAQAYVNTGMTTGPYYAPKNIGYATLAEALAKAQEFVDPNVTMLQDVKLDESLTIEAGKEIILDLNGKTITGKDKDESGSFNLFVNNGTFEIKDGSAEGTGKITLEATTNRYWNASSSIVSNSAGTLTITSGTLEHLGGTDMAYAIDNNSTLGLTTLNVDGGKIASPYRAIRQFQNSLQDNVVVVNGGTISARAGIWMQQPSTNDKAQLGTLTINDGSIFECVSNAVVIDICGGAQSNVTINGGTFSNTNENANLLLIWPLTDMNSVHENCSAVMNITGGNFTCAGEGNLIGILDGADTNGDVVLTGGIYSEDVNAYCAEGFAAVDNGNGTWTVMPVQEQSLVKGWNWYSSYLNITTENLLGALGTNGKSIVQNSTWSATYYGVNDGTDYGWGYESHTFDVSKMYMIETSQACELALSGNLVDASGITITLNPGWNWIGYPSNVEVRLEDALDGLQPSHGDEIKTQGAFASYYDYEGQSMWLTYSFGNGNMKPTKGYMYNNTSGETKTFTYNIVPATTRGNNETEVATHYSVDYTKYPFNMTMTAVVDGAIGDNYEVAALVNGEVRGSARPVYVEVLDAYMLFLTISGDNVEEVSFKYYDLTTGEEYDLVNRIDYSNNAMVGSVNEPYVLSRGTTGIGDAAMSQVNIYPNPTTTGTEINLEAVCDTVEVFNALGVKVAEYQNVDSIDALETAGIYVIRITNDGNVQNCRLVVK